MDTDDNERVCLCMRLAEGYYHNAVLLRRIDSAHWLVRIHHRDGRVEEREVGNGHLYSPDPAWREAPLLGSVHEGCAAANAVFERA